MSPMNLPALRRALDWRIRNVLTLSAPVIKRRLRDLPQLGRELNAAQRTRYHRLSADYPLDAWPQVCTRWEFLLNLYVLDICDRYIGTPAVGTRGLDIGAGGWAYLPALLSWSGRPWDGVEIDAHRRYWNLATRRGHADYMCRICPDCRYRPESMLSLHAPYAPITWFLPYVLRDVQRADGLPDRFFEPHQLLRHAWSLLAPGGQLFILNQGAAEAAAQAALCAAQGMPALPCGEINSPFSRFRQRRYAWLVTRPE